MRDGGLDDGFGLHVLAQIHDLEAVVAEHEADDVLADVVNIALNGGDNDDFLRFGIGFAFQQRLQACESRLHGFGGAQELGQEIFAALVFRAHFGDRGDEAPAHEFKGIGPGFQLLFHEPDHAFAVAENHGLLHGLRRGPGERGGVRRPAVARRPHGIAVHERGGVPVMAHEHVPGGLGFTQAAA